MIERRNAERRKGYQDALERALAEAQRENNRLRETSAAINKDWGDMFARATAAEADITRLYNSLNQETNARIAAEAELRAVRERTIEECAKVCGREMEHPGEETSVEMDAYNSGCAACAKAIRALASESNTGESHDRTDRN